MPRTAKTVTKVVKKPAVKAVKPAAKTVEKKVAVKEAGLNVPVFGLDGKEAGTMQLSKEVFGAKVNNPLLAQALRVYMNNLKAHWSNTKTRGEVAGSTRKLGAQKGSGHARHGGIRAPIYVGGGIALGPKFRKVVLDLPKKMRRAALLSALSKKVFQNEIVGVSGLEKASGKTIEMKKFMDNLKKKNALIVVDSKNEKVTAATKNIANLHVLPFTEINTFNISQHETVIFTKEAAEKLTARLQGEKA